MNNGVVAALRAAGPGDVERLLEYIRALYAADGTIPFVREAAREAVERLIADSSLGRAWLIEANGEIAGYLVVVFGYSLEWHGRDAFVDELFVEPARRSAGIGTEALRLAETACREAGVKALHLEVEHTNTRAQELYRRAGYVDHQRYLMTKVLEP